ncbi:type IV toxin-antitoxin system AbiEi family antitoxin domain-containing protein [Mycolicibacterium thermoresistibile]
MGSREVEILLADEASRQWGMFTAAQATRLGLTRRRLYQLASAERIAHTGVRGVYRFAGVPHDREDDLLRATWLALGRKLFACERTGAHTGRPDAVVSHFSACRAYRLQAAAPEPQSRVQFVVGSYRRTTSDQLRLVVDPKAQWQLVDGLPVTTPAQTVLHLYRAEVAEEIVGMVLWQALIRALADIHEFTVAFDRVTAGRGRTTVMGLLAVAGAPPSIAAGSELLAAVRT